VTTLLALIAAVVGLWALRRASHGSARAIADAATLAVVLAGTGLGAWAVTHWRGQADGTPGALAGAVVGVLVAQLARDLATRR
jgi:hypothetical protein